MPQDHSSLSPDGQAVELARDVQPGQTQPAPAGEAQAQPPPQAAEQLDHEAPAGEAQAQPPPQAAEQLDHEAPAEQAAQQAPEPTVTIEDAGNLRKKVTISVARKRIDAKFSEMFGELGKNALVPGFRIGHAPRRLVEKRFGREIAEDVRNALVGESLGKVMEKAQFKPLSEPELKLEDIKLPDEGDLTYSFEIEVAPELELPDYKNLAITRPVAELTAQQVEQALASYRRNHGELKTVDGAVAADDTLTADVKIAGEGIDYSAAGVEFRAAPAQFQGVLVEDLTSRLEGCRAGQSVQIKTKVPAAHPEASWQNKDVTLALEIKQVKRLEVPPLDEAFAARVGFDSVAELRGALRRNLQQRLGARQRQMMREQVIRQLMERAAFELPEGLALRHTARVMTRRYIDLLNRGVLAAEIEKNLDQQQGALAQQAAAELKLQFILGRIAEQENIQVDEDEVNARVAQIARQQRRRPERLRQELSQQGRLEDLSHAIREEKTIERVLELANVSDAPGAAQEDAPPAGQTRQPDGQATETT